MKTNALIFATALILALPQGQLAAQVIAVPQATPYTNDANTLLLQHFDGATTGSPGGTVTYPGDGVFGQCAHLNLGSWVGWSLGAPAQGTVEFWGKVDALSPSGLYFVGAGFSPFAYVTATVHLTSSNLADCWYHAGSSGTVTPDIPSSATVSTNVWHHYAMTWGAKGMKLYFDGLLIATNASTAAFNANTAWWCIGGQNVAGTSWGPNYFSGSIDELRISNLQREFEPAVVLGASSISLIKAYTLDYQDLKTGFNYQAQVSTDMVNWENWSAPFTATGPTYHGTNFQRMDGKQLFFRLVQQ